MCNDESNEDLYDPEAAAFFVAEKFSAEEVANLAALLTDLTIVDQLTDSENPFCNNEAAAPNTLGATIEHVNMMLKQPLFTTAFASRNGQIFTHAVGPHPPSNDGIEITTIIRSPPELGRVCICSVIKRVSENMWIVFDNHSVAM